MKLYETVYQNKLVIAAYNGRFHPMGKHHVRTYKSIVQKFGIENTYITTSDKVKLPKSPLNFSDKEKIATAHGIDPEKFVFCISGYQPVELHEKIQRERGITADDYVIVFVVGEKDMQDDPRFIGLGGMTKPTKRNPISKPKYLKKYDQAALLPASQHGYVYTIPTVDIRLPNGDESSGTNLRQFLFDSTPEAFQSAMGFFDNEIYNLLKAKFDPDYLYGDQFINEVRNRKKLRSGTQEYSNYLEEVMAELQFIKSSYESRKKSGWKNRKEASKIQDAYAEIRRLRNKNNKLLNQSVLSEAYVLSAKGNNVTIQKEKEVFSARDFLRKLK